MHFRLHRSITKEAVATVRALLTMGPCTFENVQTEYVVGSQRHGILDERFAITKTGAGVGVLASQGGGSHGQRSSNRGSLRIRERSKRVCHGKSTTGNFG